MNVAGISATSSVRLPFSAVSRRMMKFRVGFILLSLGAEKIWKADAKIKLMEAEGASRKNRDDVPDFRDD